MKKYLMFIFLLLFCSTLSARFIFDGKLVFSKHGTSRDRFAYLIIERKDGTVEDTFAIIDTLGNVYWKNYKVYAEFDSLKTGVIWTLAGEKHFFILDEDTGYIQMNDGIWTFHSNNQAFSFTGGGPLFFYGNLYGFGDGATYFKTRGSVWGLDENDNERYSYIFFHGDVEHLKADSVGEILEWTGRGGLLATYAELDSILSGVIWTLNSKKHYFVYGSDTGFIHMADGTFQFYSTQSYSFGGGVPAVFYGNIRGFGDEADFKMDGGVWGLDQNNTERYCHIFFHGDENEKVLIDSIGEIFEWTGKGGFLAKGAKLTERLKVIYDVSEWWDTLAHIQADTSGVDRWVTGLLIDGEAINDTSDFPLKLEDKDGNILFTVKGDGLMEGYNLNRQFSFQCAGDIFNMTPNAVALLGWITPAEIEQDLSPHNHDFDYHGFATSDRTAKGLVWRLGFDPGQATYLETPDHDDFSFIDGEGDGFTMGGWYRIKPFVTPQTMWSKWDETTATPLREWRMFIDDDETLVMMLWDESNDTDPYRTSDAAISAGWHLILAVYNGDGGSVAASGITLYVDGKVEASTATNDIAYVRMENTNTPVSVGIIKGTAGQLTDFWSNDMGHQFITTDQFTADEVWELHLRTRGYYNE